MHQKTSGRAVFVALFIGCLVSGPLLSGCGKSTCEEHPLEATCYHEKIEEETAKINNEINELENREKTEKDEKEKEESGTE